MAAEWLFTRSDGTTLAMGTDPDHSDYIVEGFDPFRTPDVRSFDQDSPLGEQGAVDVDGGRPMKVRVHFVPWDDPADLQAAFEVLAAFFQSSFEDIRIDWTAPGMEQRTRWVRSRGVDDLTADQDGLLESVEIRLRALNPRTYGPEQTETIGSTPEVVDIGGTMPSKAWGVVVEGPCVNPRVSLTDATGAAFTVNASVTLTSDEDLIIDGRLDEARVLNTVTGAYRYNVYLTADGGYVGITHPIGPGDCTVSFTRTSGATTTATLRYRPGFH